MSHLSEQHATQLVRAYFAVIERLRYRLYPRRGDMNMGELGEHNALPAWGSVVISDPGDYVGRHRKSTEPCWRERWAGQICGFHAHRVAGAVDCWNLRDDHGERL